MSEPSWSSATEKRDGNFVLCSTSVLVTVDPRKFKFCTDQSGCFFMVILLVDVVGPELRTTVFYTSIERE
jgi:hypothetical protein